jgi:hypothetical protein
MLYETFFSAYTYQSDSTTEWIMSKDIKNLTDPFWLIDSWFI